MLLCKDVRKAGLWQTPKLAALRIRVRANHFLMTMPFVTKHKNLKIKENMEKTSRPLLGAAATVGRLTQGGEARGTPWRTLQAKGVYRVFLKKVCPEEGDSPKDPGCRHYSWGHSDCYGPLLGSGNQFLAWPQTRLFLFLFSFVFACFGALGGVG